MALFVAQLAFVEAGLLDAAKLGVLVGSGVAGVLALLLGRQWSRASTFAHVAQTDDEAEASTEL